MKKHGLPAIWVTTVGIAALVAIQFHALDHGINGTLLIFVVCAIGSLVAGFVGFKISDWRK